MSGKYRTLHTSFWNEDPETYEMTTEPKMFYAYLLTSPWSKQCGISQISFKAISDQTGHNIENVKNLIKRFEEEYKKVRYNPATKELAIKNWVKWNCQGKNPKVEICIQKELKSVKDKSLIEYVWGRTREIPEESEKDQAKGQDRDQQNEDIREIFMYWQKEMNHPRASLDEGRRKKIRARLNDGHTREECLLAIKGCKGSAFHMGDNDGKVTYDSIDLIFRNASKTDDFIRRSKKKLALVGSIEGKAENDNYDWGDRHGEE